MAVLGVRREGGGEVLVGLFNFGGESLSVPLPAGDYADLLTGAQYTGSAALAPYGFLWLRG